MIYQLIHERGLPNTSRTDDCGDTLFIKQIHQLTELIPLVMLQEDRSNRTGSPPFINRLEVSYDLH